MGVIQSVLGGGELGAVHSCWGHLMVQSPNPGRVSFSHSVFRSSGWDCRWRRTRVQRVGWQKDRLDVAIKMICSPNFPSQVMLRFSEIPIMFKTRWEDLCASASKCRWIKTSQVMRKWLVFLDILKVWSHCRSSSTHSAMTSLVRLASKHCG